MRGYIILGSQGERFLFTWAPTPEQAFSKLQAACRSRRCLVHPMSELSTEAQERLECFACEGKGLVYASLTDKKQMETCWTCGGSGLHNPPDVESGGRSPEVTS